MKVNINMMQLAKKYVTLHSYNIYRICCTNSMLHILFNIAHLQVYTEGISGEVGMVEMGSIGFIWKWDNVPLILFECILKLSIN